ncbi:UNVERIFIED_CONTAM: hypothetical protein HDU68_010598 [Siphonaria sp. JEL0065]|nr:hypothetical protein HDU68_010598 [Siphonaria sp. JEL0065]
MSASSDCAALVASFPNAGFNPSNCCASSLVTCDGAGRVIYLNTGCSTGGQSWIGSTFPPQLAALTNLQQMFFDDCGMKGPIPDIFASFPNLYEIHLSYPPDSWGYATNPTLYKNYRNGNAFEGPVPASLAKTNVLYLHIESNRLTGPIPQALVDYIMTGATVKNACKPVANNCYFLFQDNCLTGVPYSVSEKTGVYVTGVSNGDERAVGADGICSVVKLDGGPSHAIFSSTTTAVATGASTTTEIAVSTAMASASTTVTTTKSSASGITVGVVWMLISIAFAL